MSGRPLVVVPVRGGVLPAGGLESIAEAQAAGDARIVLIGDGLEAVIADLASIADSVETLEAGAFAVTAWSALLAPLAAEASFVLLPGSPDGRDLAVRLGARIECDVVTGALAVSADAVTVSHHGGLVQTALRPTGRFIATLQPNVRGVDAHGGPDTEESEATVVSLAVQVEPLATARDAAVVRVEAPEASAMDLAESARIVGAGAGLMADEGQADALRARFERLRAVGASLGASMGATRVVTDAGWVGHDRQIGTTGVVVDPDLYVAFGVSGAVQHTAGLGHPDHIISVNLDPHCPMMAMADLAVVADGAATLDAIAELLHVGDGSAQEVTTDG